MQSTESHFLKNQAINNWWADRRWKYNKGLIIAGISAFFLYAILGDKLIAPYDDNFEITLFTTAFQGIGYLFMMAIANLFYLLGPFVDKSLNKNNAEKFRVNLFNLGYWFSVAFPFLIPVATVIQYFTMYRK